MKTTTTLPFAANPFQAASAYAQHTPVNTAAPLYCQDSLFIKAQPEKAWQVLTNIAHWPQWMPKVTKSQLHGALCPGTSFDWKASGAHIHSTLHTVVPQEAIGWTGKTMGIKAVHNWTFQKVEGGTLVSVEESLEGFLAKLFRKPFLKSLKKDMRLSLEALKRECEN